MILQRIVADNLAGLEERKKRLPLAQMKEAALAQPSPLDFAAALCGEGLKLIAEVKKASPSKGVIRGDFRPVEIARVYAAGGAAAISVLTEARHFQGSLDYLRAIKDALGDKPLLRKDFIFDPYQVYEARAYGADALLLIVAMLEPGQMTELLALSRELGMGCLVEVHNEAELEVALASGASIIGINNRDLTSFTVDLAVTGRLRPLIPPDRLVVSESGIRSRDDIERVREWGVDAVLIGESFMAVPDIAARMRELF